MARFSFPSFQALTPIPPGAKELWMTFGQTLATLRKAFQNGIVLSENLEHVSYGGGVEHAQNVVIEHGLGRSPAQVILTSGRVEFVTQVSVNSTQAILLFRLLTATASSYGTGRTLTDRLITVDAPFFREGDAVVVDGLPNRITKVSGTSIYLSSLVTSITQHSISLATEQVKLLFL
jgi:hypothetical protein